MKQSAAGSCLFTAMTIEQVEDLKVRLERRSGDDNTYVFPEALLVLQAAIEGEPIEIVDANVQDL